MIPKIALVGAVIHLEAEDVDSFERKRDDLGRSTGSQIFLVEALAIGAHPEDDAALVSCRVVDADRRGERAILAVKRVLQGRSRTHAEPSIVGAAREPERATAHASILRVADR